MKFFSTFSGIGLFDYGLELAGWECVGQCEIEPFGRTVLRHHWPNTWIHDDVKTLSGELIREHCGRIDAITGGVPCQPSSVAGQRLGASDDRWLWPDFMRLVSEVEPVWVLAENPRGVLSMDVEGIRFDEWIAREFESLGYSLLPILLAAEDVGAPHRRERVWFVGQCVDDARRQRLQARRNGSQQEEARELLHNQLERAGAPAMANANSRRQPQSQGRLTDERGWIGNSGKGVGLADSCGERLEGQRGRACGAGKTFTLPTSVGHHDWPARPGEQQYPYEHPRLITDTEAQSALGLTANGRAKRLAARWRNESIAALGNAVVPQCAEAIGRAILGIQ